MVTKLCPQCGEVKPADQFYRNSGHKDGLSSWCQPCTKEDRHRRWRDRHPEPAPWVMPTEKRCTKCGVIKPLDQFHKRSAAKDGHQPACAACMTAAATAFNKANPAYHRQKAKEYRLRHPDRHADNNLRWRLGVPWGTYAQMLEAQEGKCAICETADPGARISRFHVDHDKETGIVRGLLCSRCNTGIGQLRHSKPLLLSAIEYLDRTSR